MLQPLDRRMLEALSQEGDGDEELDSDPYNHIGDIRAQIKEGRDWALGVRGLLVEGGQFKTFIQRTKDLTCDERMGSDDWCINFYDPPLRDLSVRPSPGGVIQILAFEKPVQSFRIMGCRKNWPALLSWIWGYGKKIDMMTSKQKGGTPSLEGDDLAKTVAVSAQNKTSYYNNITMLQPLDSERMDALAREGDVDEGMEFHLHSHISTIRRQIKEDGDWGLGVWGLMIEGGRILASIRRTKPMSYEERKGSNDWYLELGDFAFRDLTLQPSPGGIVDIYAFGKRLKSFQILGCRKNWPALVRWIWEYGDKKVKMKLKQEGQKKSRRQLRRVERPLLHQVLRPAKFKAQHERKSRAKDTAAISDDADVILNDADMENSLFSNAPDTANPMGPGTSDEKMMPPATFEDVNINALKVPTTIHEKT